MSSSPYTHIVVGAGSAGCVVTRRISDNERFNVLLIEAGPDTGPDDTNMPHGVQDARKVPMKGQSEMFDDRIDWNVKVEIPDGQPMVVPQARIMGGGSSINGGTALRHTINDSREWVALGNDQWDHASTSKVYDSLEYDELRGTKGPHPIVRTSLEESGPIQQAFVNGALDRGMRPVADLNGQGAEGVGPSPVCRRGDRRISAANTFIDPIRGRKNLTIVTDTQVDHLTLGDGKRVNGVKLIDGRSLYASHEVILCAGAIFSPAILQRSGIGPSDLLQSLAIPIIADLPVGAHLSDHPCVPIVARAVPGMYEKTDYSLQQQARWSSSARPGTTDLQIICFSYLFAQAPDPRVQGGRSLGGTASGHVSGIGCNVNKPTSLGTVRIRSRAGRNAPIVAPQYFTTQTDRDTAREVVRAAYAIMTSSPMREKLSEPLGIDQRTIASDSLLDEYIHSQYSTTYHFCGSCRMANREQGGVVDQSGRVYGVPGLRVCDASVIPTVPAANTMWTTMMFAERIGRSIANGRDVRGDVLERRVAKL